MKITSDKKSGRNQVPLTSEKNNAVFFIIKSIAVMVLPLLYKIRVEGHANIPNNGPFVLLPKHQRWMDVPLVGLAAARYLYYVAKAELFVHPLGNWFISAIGGIPLNRKRPIESRQTLRTIRRCLQSNSGLVLFPEGTYYPGKMGPGHQGILRFITSASSVPLIPVGIRYEKRALRTTVTIRFGAPIKWTGKQKAGKKIKAEALLPIIMEDIARLSELKAQH